MQLFCLQLEASCLQLSFFAYSCAWELFCLQLELLYLQLKLFYSQLSFFAYNGKVCLRQRRKQRTLPPPKEDLLENFSGLKENLPGRW